VLNEELAVAALAWREELRRNDGNDGLANPHVPLHAAALAVLELVPEMTLDQTRTFAQKACAWAAQAHHAWFWRGIPGSRY
jgi:hypothetical protein